MFMRVSVKKIATLLLFCLIIVTILMSFLVPKSNSNSFNNICFIIFLFMTFLFFKIKRKKNYFDFDSIFIMLYAIVAFVFPVFLFKLSAPYENFYNLKYNVNLVSKGVYISLLGISGYYAGSFCKACAINETQETRRISSKLLVIIVLILALLFYLLGGIQFYQSIYLKNVSAPSGPLMHVIALLQVAVLTTIANEAYNKRNEKEYSYNKVFLAACILVSLSFLYAGNRTYPSFFLLPLAYWYIKEYKPINFWKFSIMIFSAILLMWVVQQTRVGSEVKLSNGASVLKDLTIVDRDTYIGIEYVNKYGLTYGKTMLNGIIGVFPSLERILTTLFGLNTRNFGSAELFTDYTFKGDSGFGLGTNIFIDIFLSFGYVGTYLLLFLLGFFVKHAYEKLNVLSYYYYIIYTVLIASSVYMVRSSFTYPLRLLIWSLILGNINKSLTRRILNSRV